MRRRRDRGLTLVELLVVIGMISLVYSVAAVSMKSSRGDKAPSFARTLLGMAHEARHAALSLGQTTRLRAIDNHQLIAERLDPTNGWVALNGAAQAPVDVELCTIQAVENLTTSTSSCPVTAGQSVCLTPAGQVSVSANNTCPGVTPRTGATLYVHTIDDAKQYKVVLFGLTGLPRLMDRW